MTRVLEKPLSDAALVEGDPPRLRSGQLSAFGGDVPRTIIGYVLR